MNDQQSPTARILTVLEYLMSAGPGPVKQVDIARACGLSPSTLNRIVRDLSDRGYLFRTSERYCVRNFRLERNVPVSAGYLKELHHTVADLTDELGVSVEAVVVAGHELLWHTKSDHPDPSVSIIAHSGYRRPLYELDALSRLYLSRLTAEGLDRGFYMKGFYLTHRRTEWLAEDAVRRIVAEDRKTDFIADSRPNHVGIVRYATHVSSPTGRFLHLLGLADAGDRASARKTERFRGALLAARIRLCDLVRREDAQNRPPPLHHTGPLGGT